MLSHRDPASFRDDSDYSVFMAFETDTLERELEEITLNRRLSGTIHAFGSRSQGRDTDLRVEANMARCQRWVDEEHMCRQTPIEYNDCECGTEKTLLHQRVQDQAFCRFYGM